MSWDNLYPTLLFYGFLLWAVFKLAKIDRWAEASLYSVVLFLPLLILSLGLPFGLSYGVLRLFGVGVIPSSALATIAMMAVCNYFLIPLLKRDSDSRGLVKRIRQYLTNNSLEDKYYKNDIQRQFKLLIEGVEEKWIYILGASAFFILIFFLGRDIEALKAAYFIYDYQLGLWKYFAISSVLAACIFAYSKYYNAVINSIYLNWQRLLRALEIEGKCAVITYDSWGQPPYKVTECPGDSWFISNDTDSRLGFFVESEDGLCDAMESRYQGDQLLWP